MNLPCRIPSALLRLAEGLPQSPAEAEPAPAAAVANEWFHTVYLFLIVLIPTLIVILLAAAKKKSKPALPAATDFSWEPDVLDSEVPVVIHAHNSWSVGDRVIENQVAKLGEVAGPRAKVLWLDIDKCPAVIDRHPTLEEKCVALFIRGRLVWQARGVHDHMTMWREIEREIAMSAAREEEIRHRTGAGPAAGSG